MSIRLTPRSAAVGMAWPAFPNAIPGFLLALQQQFAQSEQWAPERLARHHDLEVKLVARGLSAESEEKLRENLRTSLGEHFSVLLTYHAEIPRTPSGKFFDFLSEVPG